MKMNKTRRINIRLTEDEYNYITQRQMKSNLNLSRYCEEQLSGRNVIVIDGISPLCHELRKIGDNLNQLTILAHQGRISCVNLSETQERTKEIWKTINEIYNLKKVKLKNGEYD